MKKNCCTKLVLSMNFLSSFWFQRCQTYLFLLEVTILTFEGWGKARAFFSLLSFYVKVLWGIPIWNTSFHMYIKVKGDWERERGKNQEERERKRKRERDRERERESKFNFVQIWRYQNPLLYFFQRKNSISRKKFFCWNDEKWLLRFGFAVK